MARRTAAHQRALAEAKARERAAGKKVSRIESRGVNVAKSAFDPRVGARRLKSMTTNELKAHTRRLNTFTDRRTQFVGLFAGTPAPRSMWNEYKRLEAVNNDRAAAFLARFGGSKLPEQDQTISGRIAMTTPEQRANNQGRVHEHIEREAFSITGAEKLQTLIDSMKKKARGDYTNRTVRSRLNSGEAVLKYSGNGDLIEAVEKLTLDQKQLLIDASTFFDIALEQFDSPDKSEVTQIQDAYYEEHEGVGKNIHVREELERQLNWVKEIAPRGSKSSGTPGTNPATGAKKSAPRRGNRRRP